LGDDALLGFRHRSGSLHPLRRRDAGALGEAEREVADALDVLAELHRGRNRRPAAETLSLLLAAVRAHAGIAIWPTGEQALANCLRVVDLARRFERRGASSFRAFVERLEEQAERGEAAEAPVVEEGTEGVRIMTVHRAKGLEFPVVILADPTARKVGRNPSRHVDPARRVWAEPLCGCVPLDLLAARDEELRRDEEEGVRIAYVAATRARDLLVLPALGDAKPSGWLEVFHPALYPPYGSHRAARPAPGCPPFGDDSVLVRPESARRGSDGSVQPGLQQPRAGRHEVVWWDPSRLVLDVEESVGLRQERILTADASGVAAEAGERRHVAWQEARRAALERGSEPLLRVEAVTALAAARGGDRAGVALERSAPDAGIRPGGARFGSLVHAILAVVPLDADAARVQAVAGLQGRLLGATLEEVEAAASAAVAALAHPLLRRAAASPALRRETPVLWKLPEGTLAEGVVDLAFREAQGWTVVDFKTDREIGERRREYEAQVRLYADAVSAATGDPASAVLLVV
jgi:ATP-dependent exoDNAse (exonuclease V) beta subunit